jgi:hypothetical protein
MDAAIVTVRRPKPPQENKVIRFLRSRQVPLEDEEKVESKFKDLIYHGGVQTRKMDDEEYEDEFERFAKK